MLDSTTQQLQYKYQLGGWNLQQLRMGAGWELGLDWNF